jgi:hypothetical protein
VGENENGMQCEIYERWYHIECQDILEEVYTAISEVETIHWFCNICNISVKSFAKLQGRMDKIKAELTADSKGAYY